jgi:hypothetical protein
VQRRPNWKPVIVPKSPRAEIAEVRDRYTISHAAVSKGGPSSDADRRGTIQFAIAAALALGLPAAIGFGLYFVAHAVIVLS